MSQQELKEILNSYAYGYSVEEIMRIYDLTEEEVKQLAADNAEEIERIDAYRRGLGIE